MRTRIIAKLDCKPPYVIKPVLFDGVRKVGSPVGLAEKYYNQAISIPLYPQLTKKDQNFVIKKIFQSLN